MSKGSTRRPSSVPEETVAERWERTFGVLTSLPDDSLLRALESELAGLKAAERVRIEGEREAILSVLHVGDDFEEVGEAFRLAVERQREEMLRIGGVEGASSLGVDPKAQSWGDQLAHSYPEGAAFQRVARMWGGGA